MGSNWLSRLLGLLLPFAKVNGPAVAERPSTVVAKPRLAPPDVDLLGADPTRLARQVAEEDERAAGAIAVAGLSTLDMDDLLNRLVVRMVEVSEASVGGILLLDESEGVLRPGAYHGLPVADLSSIRIPLGKGFAGRVASERKPMTLLDADRNSVVLNPYVRQRGIKAMLGAPIIVGERLLGVAHVDRLDNHVFTPAEIRRLQGMAAQAALAIYHAILHKRLEAANAELAATNRRLQAVIAATPAGVAILEAPSGRVVDANAAAERLWGHGPVADVGLPHLQTAYGLFRLNGEPYEANELPMARSLQAGETVAGEEVIVKRPDGKQTMVLLSSAPLRAADGTIEGAIAVFQDTSGMQLERIKDQFISVTAHELFTPLTVVKGTAQLLMRRLAAGESDPSTIAALQVIDGRANWMTYLLQKLLDAAEVQLGPLHLRRRRVDLPRLAEAAAKRMQISTRRHEVVFLDEAESLIGFWDRERIDRVLTNLIENAIKYSPEGGRVEVSVSRVSAAHPFDPHHPAGSRDWAVVRVMDHGPGIAKSQQAHIFRRFYRAGPSNYQESAGLGLGLYISNRIVTAHGGQMALESEEGKGSTFAFALPLDDDESAPVN